MNNRILKILNPVLLAAFLVTVIAVTLYRVPGRWQYDANGVGRIHEIGGIVFVILAVFHLILNRQWIKTQIFGIKPKK